jgi:2-succinyl-5-enolpyruvyl-6-hydroxy-3-cyclohexene-1-carboxylate synthase
VIVINNGGGRIFDYLPQHGLPGFARLWRTPVAPDFGALADAFAMTHRRVCDADACAGALAGAETSLVEVVIDADASRAVHLDFWRTIAATDDLATS